MRIAVLALAALTLAACSGAFRFVYMRADGQDMSANPALYQQFEADRAVCQGEMYNKDAYVGTRYITAVPDSDTVHDCMVKKGYMVVSEDAAAAKQQEFAAAAAEKARREAEAAAPPPPPPAPPPRRVATKPKPKPKPPATQPVSQTPSNTSQN